MSPENLARITLKAVPEKAWRHIQSQSCDYNPGCSTDVESGGVLWAAIAEIGSLEGYISSFWSLAEQQQGLGGSRMISHGSLSQGPLLYLPLKLKIRVDWTTAEIIHVLAITALRSVAKEILRPHASFHL